MLGDCGFPAANCTSRLGGIPSSGDERAAGRAKALLFVNTPGTPPTLSGRPDYRKLRHTRKTHTPISSRPSALSCFPTSALILCTCFPFCRFVHCRRDRRPARHSGWAGGCGPADGQKLGGAETLLVGVLQRRRVLRAGGGEVEVRLHLRDLAAHPAQEISGGEALRCETSFLLLVLAYHVLFFLACASMRVCVCLFFFGL